MINKKTIEDLEGKYLLALQFVNKIEVVHNYPKYPNEINEFMGALTQDPWGVLNYGTHDSQQILKSIESADLFQIRCVLTALGREERFCEGAWIVSKNK